MLSLEIFATNLREGDQVQYQQIETETGLQASDVSIVQ